MKKLVRWLLGIKPQKARHPQAEYCSFKMNKTQKTDTPQWTLTH